MERYELIGALQDLKGRALYLGPRDVSTCEPIILPEKRRT